ncbi:MAG: hypothetical protein OEV40_18020 [Acidimicrobiia bacterium]|nr:hypothetical protein [Acidimicrobiia bacterium]
MSVAGRLDTLTGEIVATGDLCPADRAQMFELMHRYYENVNEVAFGRDLGEKDWVIVARCAATGGVRGFSTQKLIEASAGRRILFSGDTIVEQAYWGRNPIAEHWGRLAIRLHLQAPERELLWYLISKGYKTYRLLPTYFAEFHPRFDTPTPRWALDLLAELGHARYPGRYDADGGIVRARPCDERLRPLVAPVEGRHRNDPHVRFFERRNPGHAAGDELCCLAPMRPDNLTAAALDLLSGGV